MKQLDLDIMEMLYDYPFFARVLIRMRKLPNNNIPTLGVTVNKNGVEMHYNPTFYEFIESKDDRFFVLMHECLHLMHDHISRFNMVMLNPSQEEQKNNMMANMATDASINSLLKPMLTEVKLSSKDKPSIEIITPASLKKLLKLSYTPDSGRESEYYFNIIKENQDALPKNYEYKFDEHSFEGQQSEDTLPKEMKENAVRELFKKADKESKGFNRGLLPKDLEKALRDFIEQTSTVNWKTLLRNYINSSDNFTLDSTRTKINRRYGIKAPGDLKEYTRNIVAVIDTSGSVYEEQMRMALEEIKKIADLDDEVTVVQCDAQVQEVKKFTNAEDFTVKGMGGTAYQPGLDKARELKADVIVYIGDGMCEPNLTPVNIPVVWALYEGCDINCSFGKKVILTKEER